MRAGHPVPSRRDVVVGRGHGWVPGGGWSERPLQAQQSLVEDLLRVPRRVKRRNGVGRLDGVEPAVRYARSTHILTRYLRLARLHVHAHVGPRTLGDSVSRHLHGHTSLTLSSPTPGPLRPQSSRATPPQAQAQLTLPMEMP